MSVLKAEPLEEGGERKVGPGGGCGARLAGAGGPGGGPLRQAVEAGAGWADKRRRGRCCPRTPDLRPVLPQVFDGIVDTPPASSPRAPVPHEPGLSGAMALGKAGARAGRALRKWPRGWEGVWRGPGDRGHLL